MAKTKAAGAAARQGSNVRGKRLGLKVHGGQKVRSGEIIVRQRGRNYIPGQNVGMGRDFTIFSKIDGVVEFVNKTRKKKQINVLES